MNLAEPFPERLHRKPTASDVENEMAGFESLMGMVGA